MIIDEIVPNQKDLIKDNIQYTDGVSKQHQHFRELLQIKVNGNTNIKSEHNEHSSQTSSDRNIPMIYDVESPYKLVYFYFY